MQFLFNELSFHSQFHSVNDFYNAVERVMEIRRAIRGVGFELFCCRNILSAKVTADLNMSQAIQGMPREKKQAWILWLTSGGPYWTDERQHLSDEWFESPSESVVTDTAVGEAAFCRFHGLEHEVLSIDPSNWLRDPIKVIWRRADLTLLEIDVPNHWSLNTVEQKLTTTPVAFDSWRSLEQYVRLTCGNLIISVDAFDNLKGYPFVPGAADRIRIRLNVLNKLRGCFDDDGNRTTEGNQIYTQHFTGGKAWFTDSSDYEKTEFKSEMTFPHPEKIGEYLFCTWHGKVKTPQIRIHFSWPISANVPLYVVYVGIKITMQ